MLGLKKKIPGKKTTIISGKLKKMNKELQKIAIEVMKLHNNLIYLIGKKPSKNAILEVKHLIKVVGNLHDDLLRYGMSLDWEYRKKKNK